MVSPTQAPPEAVEQLGQLPEYELTPDGKVVPLKTQSQAESSPQVSQSGTGVETVGSPAEAPTKPSVVEMVQPAPVAQQPEPAPAQAPAEEELEDTEEAEARLDAFLQEQVQAQLDQAQKQWQSTFDKRAAQLDRQLQDATTREKALTQQIRELQTRDLTDEERAQILAKFSQEDERGELDSYRGQLVEYHRDLMVQSLLLEFSPYGATREEIEQFESPEEMEAHCYEVKANYLDAELTKVKAAPAQVAAPVAQPTATATQPAPQPAPQVPAGVTAPVDLGSGGATPTGPQFNPARNPEALRENLRNMKWDTIRIR